MLESESHGKVVIGLLLWLARFDGAEWKWLKESTVNKNLSNMNTKSVFRDTPINPNPYPSSGVSCTGSLVNWGSKCSKSLSLRTLGLYGGVICLLSNNSQSMERKNVWFWISWNPVCGWQPNLSLGSWSKTIKHDKEHAIKFKHTSTAMAHLLTCILWFWFWLCLVVYKVHSLRMKMFLLKSDIFNYHYINQTSSNLVVLSAWDPKYCMIY